MRVYEKPTVMIHNGVSEGIYMASGSAECYTVTTNIHQTPQEGRGDFRIQVDATHAATDDHHSSTQVLTISFNQDVTYVSSNGTLVSGDGTTSLKIQYNYHNNANEFIGLGDVVVTAWVGLAVTGAQLSCDYECAQH